jgi:hypothetical protein
MDIPRSKKLPQFVRDVSTHCMASRANRTNRGVFYQNYVDTGSADPATPAVYNKLFASLDDIESLLFSPVSLRFHIGDPDIPNVVNEAKGRAAAARIRNFYRQCDADTMLSQAVSCGLNKGLGVIKQNFVDKRMTTWFVEPEDFGVLNEAHQKLDEAMGAFSHSMMITQSQFEALIYGRSDHAELLRKAKNYVKDTAGGLTDTKGSAMNIVVGGLYPLQSAAQGGVNPTRGLVDWMATPRPQLDPAVAASMLQLDETWIWDDRRADWATFQMIGDDIMILGADTIQNALAFDPTTMTSAPCLKGVHPYSLFRPNPVRNYFWGASEVQKLIFLQESINARINGTNKMLRMQEDPTTRITGSSGVNQQAWSRYKKPGGYYTENSPTAKIEKDNTVIPQDMWASLHEYERMVDELMGLPPVAKGHGEKGVRSANHAEALVRMFSPRFKDRALLIERDVEHCAALTLDLARAHDDRKLCAWVPEKSAGLENVSTKEELELLIPPAPGLVPVWFTFADLDDNLTLVVDSHSASPAFAAEEKSLVFDLLKVGAMSPAEAIEHLDISGVDELQASIVRRDIAKAESQEKEQALKLKLHGGGKK